jgi:hypothetical protein
MMVTCALVGPRTQSSGRTSRKEGVGKGRMVGGGDGSVAAGSGETVGSVAARSGETVGAAVGASVATGAGVSVAVGRWAVGEETRVAVGSLVLAQAPNKKAPSTIKEKCLSFVTFPLLLKSKA